MRVSSVTVSALTFADVTGQPGVMGLAIMLIGSASQLAGPAIERRCI